MAVENVINGTDLIVFMDVLGTPTPIAYGSTYTLSIPRATRNTTNKNSGDLDEFKPGRLDATASTTCLKVYGSFEALYNAHLAGDVVTLSFGPTDDGDLVTDGVYASGDFFINKIDENAPDGENTTYTVAFEHADGFTYHNLTTTTTEAF